MKTATLTIIFSLATVFLFGQTRLLKSYDFDKGDYSLIGVRSESDPNGLADTLGEFFTNDISVLNSFKREWIFKKPGLQNSCGYHYVISICKNGLSIESFHINLNCNLIATDKGYFFFDAKKLRMFKGKLAKPLVKREKFSSIIQARVSRNRMLSQKDLIMLYTPVWTKYEGEFSFTYTCKKVTGNCLDQESRLLKQLTQEIQTAYPAETFELDGVGGSNTELFVNVKCNQTLVGKFKLYPLNWKKWEPYDLLLTSYWTK